MSREGKSRYRTMVLILIIGVLVGYIGAQIMPLSRFFRKPLPRFSVIDFSYDPSVRIGQYEGGMVYLTIQNIGDGDAHNVEICARVEVGNVSYTFLHTSYPLRPVNIPSKGVWKVDILTTPIRTPFVTGMSVHLDVNITCVEEVTQKFTYQF